MGILSVGVRFILGEPYKGFVVYYKLCSYKMFAQTPMSLMAIMLSNLDY